MTFDPNKPETWADVQVYSPPDFDLAGYQSKLDEAAGLSDNGQSIVRLVWAGDRKRCYSKWYVTWYERGPKQGLGLSSELRAKYKYASVLVAGTSDVIDVPPPRWIFEQYEYPGQYMPSWEAARFVNGREQRPAPPPNGYYSWLMTIADHSAKICCEEAVKNKMVCWGNYRAPDDTDIEIIKKGIFLREKDDYIDPRKPLDDRTLEKIAKETEERLAEKERLIEQRMDEYIEENALELMELAGIQISGRARKLFSIPKSITGATILGRKEK